MFPFVTVKKAYTLKMPVEKVIRLLNDMASKENLLEYNLLPIQKTADQKSFQFVRYYFRMNNIYTSTYLISNLIPDKEATRLNVNFKTNPIWWIFIALILGVLCVALITGSLDNSFKFFTMIIGCAVIIFIDWSTKQLMLASLEKYLLKIEKLNVPH